jgi:kynureninase
MSAPDYAQLDRDDPLAHLRSQFELPTGRIYLDGNSLGALPLAVKSRLADVVAGQWGQDLIASWNRHHWIDLPITLGERIAPLVGAAPGQVLCTDSISVNLFKLLAVALQLRPGRRVILSQQDNFPTDLYMAEGLAGLLGNSRCESRAVPEARLLDSLDDSVAVLMLTQVNFRTGHLHDMQEITAAAQRAGALVLWDLAHSAGALPVELDACAVDMAVGCGYKYLNGGPGAPAFLYLAQRHQDQVQQPLSGWMGHQRAFDFDPRYEPASGIARFLSGTPGILGMAALDAALDVFAGLELAQLRRKSLTMTRLFMDAVTAEPALAELGCLTPRADARRGSQVSLCHPHGYAIAQALIERGIIVDFRAPDIIRFGFAPLYNSYIELGTAVTALVDIVAHRHYEAPRFQLRSRVT